MNDDTAIYSYTRAQAIADGVLIDVSKVAREAGIRHPVAVTHALWMDITTIPPRYAHEDIPGRLWDVVWMGRPALAGAAPAATTLHYQLTLHVGRRSLYTVKAVIGPGDDGAPVITLMRPDED